MTPSAMTQSATTLSAATSSPAPRARIARSLSLIVGLVLLSCACRTLPDGAIPVATDDGIVDAPAGPELISKGEHVAAAAEKTANVPVECVPYEGLPIPVVCESPWAPPGLAGPWPHDEYLHDGGDREVMANMGPGGEVRGLELEDTVAVYETIDGHTKIKPSNRVCLYAPRFAAVRQVTTVVLSEQREVLRGVAQPIAPSLHQDDQLATTAVQPIQPEGEIGSKQSSIERVKEGPEPAISEQPIAGVQNGFKLYENFRVIRQGIFEEAEKAHLLESIQAAIAWTSDQAVQVVLQGQQAVDVTGDQRAQATFRVDYPNNPCLRIIKTASTKMARPGDIVDFTLRFDNVGDQEIAQRDDHRQPHDAARIRRKQPASQPRGRVHLRAKHRRLARAAMGFQRSPARRPRRPDPLSLPRAVTKCASVWGNGDPVGLQRISSIPAPPGRGRGGSVKSIFFAGGLLLGCDSDCRRLSGSPNGLPSCSSVACCGGSISSEAC